MNKQGFTLLEMLVATFIMGVAVVGLLSNISTSLRVASKLTDYDRAALLAKRKMDELLIAPRLPKLAPFGDRFDPDVSGGIESGWQARLTMFELPPQPAPGMAALERLELQVWWMSGGARRTVSLEAFRRTTLSAQDLGGGP
jgi:prepilin-type N-terminal cleavage/methylation domain-containing protein